MGCHSSSGGHSLTERLAVQIIHPTIPVSRWQDTLPGSDVSSCEWVESNPLLPLLLVLAVQYGSKFSPKSIKCEKNSKWPQKKIWHPKWATTTGLAEPLSDGCHIVRPTFYKHWSETQTSAPRFASHSIQTILTALLFRHCAPGPKKATWRVIVVEELQKCNLTFCLSTQGAWERTAPLSQK